MNAKDKIILTSATNLTKLLKKTYEQVGERKCWTAIQLDEFMTHNQREMDRCHIEEYF